MSLENIALIPLDRNHLSLIHQKRHDRELVAQLGANFRYIPQDVEDKWYEGCISGNATQVRCCIIDKASPDVILGTVNLTSIDWTNRNAEFSIQMFRRQGEGIGMKASQLMLDHAFKDLNLHRVYLTVLVENERALLMYNKLGFLTEGRLVDSVFKDGQYKSQFMMAKLNIR